MVPALPWFLAAAACSPPGVLWGPDGRTELRTASYALGIRDGLPEMSILLSNGVLACSAPVWGEPGVAESLEAEATGSCREGAQHVVLSVLDPHGAWVGEFPGLGRDAEPPRRASGAYYSVQEAVLMDVIGLSRTYFALEDRFLPSLGPGTVWLDPATAPGELGSACEDGVGRVRGWFSFPNHDLSGRFVASPCACTDASTFQILAECLPFRCQRLGGNACE